MSVQLDLIKQFRDHQQRYSYYLIALCVASIAFSVNKTLGVPLNKSQIPLAFAIMAWAISIFSGFRFITLITASLYTNVELADEHDKLRSQTEKTYFEKLTREKMQPVSEMGANLYNRQTKTFYLGMILFLAWHIYEMYLLLEG
jgi:hypothetical protein